MGVEGGGGVGASVRLMPRPRRPLGLGWWGAAPPCSLPSALTWDDGVSRGAARPPVWTEERLEAQQGVMGCGGCLGSWSFMLQSLESRFLSAGGRELRSRVAEVGWV